MKTKEGYGKNDESKEAKKTEKRKFIIESNFRWSNTIVITEF